MVIARRRITLYKGIIRDMIKLLIQNALREGNYITQFEKEFANYIGVKYAISVSSARAGLYLILETLSLEKESEIILPNYTDLSVPEVIKLLNLKPVFVDINPQTDNMDINILKQKLTTNTRVIIATHIFGRPCNLDEILNIAKKYNIIVVEDCAHTCGAEYKNKKVGSFGYTAIFSFSPTKNFNTFGGGMITTNEDEFFKKIKERIDKCGMINISLLLKRILLTFFLYFLTTPLVFTFILPLIYLLYLLKLDISIYKKIFEKGIKSHINPMKFTNLQALIGLKQLRNIEEINNIQREHAHLLNKLLDRRISRLNDLENTTPTYYFYVIKHTDRERLAKRLLMKGIDTGKEIMRNCAKVYDKNNVYPQTEKTINTTLQIPIYHTLTNHQIEYIAKIINQEYFKI